MLKKLHSLKHLIGNTQLVSLEHDQVNLFTKLEYQNLSGSVKVRPAFYILESAIKRGEIHEQSTVIESSSGNFAIALSTLCKRLGITFIPVIDPNINSIYENVLLSLTDHVEKVIERDETNGFLLTRLQRVQDLLETTPDAFWTNQYGNPDAVAGHYYGLGDEIARSFDELDYVFLGVSSCGTIAGVSKRLKEKFPNIKIVAVDTEGSVIFGDKPRKRFIPGIGSSMVPPNLEEAQIDEIMHISELDAIDGCHQILEKQSLFVGGSSGSVYAAIQNYFQNKTFAKKPNVLFICADNGTPYVNTVYNREWVNMLREQHVIA
ncbi:cysteine synthase A [Paenibacillus sophorae]|uniref:2,3-diaminopropionate biosynthesis protein SbnA n=1 Tax=Paenibacillus sophorae TaxID=1333845 RepID=A0A1H8SWQ7_9BACL|nr:2,3-diaminopropionate biosynthesis protein SbnA [Paenibacillus sophorae]QWU15599.1 2,3-diaminopropionate biosynthesis protein SbnA [Paenibacillus sophorae]SEO83419.1 cysteine synthase A [Paenibacillus sophorae]